MLILLKHNYYVLLNITNTCPNVNINIVLKNEINSSLDMYVIMYHINKYIIYVIIRFKGQ